MALILFLDQWIKFWAKGSLMTEGPVNIFGDWFRLVYVENPGMAFGYTFGAGIWAKLALSIFRLFAVFVIIYYIIKKARENTKLEVLIVLGLVLAGTAGNLIDSMFYDFIFPFDPCYTYNLQEGSGIWRECGIFGKVEVRPTGFLFSNVVDMFQFNLSWPSWVPLLGGKEVFPAVWNVADASISCGVIWVLFRQKVFFPKKNKPEVSPKEENPVTTPEEKEIK